MRAYRWKDDCGAFRDNVVLANDLVEAATLAQARIDACNAGTKGYDDWPPFQHRLVSVEYVGEVTK